MMEGGSAADAGRPYNTNDREAAYPSARIHVSCHFIAADQLALALVRRVDARLAICNLSVEPQCNYIRRSRALECRILQPRNAATDAALVAQAHACDMEVNPFYADDEPEMRRLIDCGVDGILTNHPHRLIALRQNP